MNTTYYKSALIDLKADLLARQSRLNRHIIHADSPLSSDSTERAVERQNDDVVFALDDNLALELRAVNAALERIENGIYGRCLKCAGNIEPARLDAIPYAENCVACK